MQNLMGKSGTIEIRWQMNKNGVNANNITSHDIHIDKNK